MLTKRSLLALVAVASIALFIIDISVPGAQDTLTVKDFLTTVPGILALLGITREPARAAERRQGGAAEPFQLAPSFESGVYGGLIGGAIGGVIEGWVYVNALTKAELHLHANLSNPFTFLVCGRPYTFETYYAEFIQNNFHARWFALIFLAGSMTGVFLGAAIQLGAVEFRRHSTQNQKLSVVLNEAVGGILGGTASGAIAGTLIGAFFGLRPAPAVDPATLVMASCIAATSIAVGALFYDYHGSFRNVIRSLLTATVLTALAGVPAFLLIDRANLVIRYFVCPGGLPTVIQGGAIIGLIIGTMFGVLVGFTLLLYRVWEHAAVPRATT
jgi:hypothetical protein